MNTAIRFVGGSAILGSRDHGGLRAFLNYAPQATVTYLRVWYSVHFGYYFYAARGAILVVKFFRGVKVNRKKIPKDFEENRTRVEPLLNETPPTLPTLPSAAKLESRLPYTIGSDPRRHRFVRWSDGSDSWS